MQLKPFKELIAYSKEKITEVMAAPRAKRLKLQAESEMNDIDLEVINLEGKIEESLVNEDSYKNFSFKNLISDLDKLAILERRKKQYGKVLKQLFPE